MASGKSTIDQIIDLLASIKLALVVLITLAVAAVGGTIVPQDLTPDQYLHLYGPQLYTFLSYAGLIGLYYSWWFRLLLALLLVNLLVCSAKRLPGTIRLSRPLPLDRLSRDFLTKQPLNRTNLYPGSIEENLSRMREVLQGRFGRLEETQTQWGTLLRKEKGAFSRFGAYVVHTSLLFIVAGALIGGAYGFSANLLLNEGETTDRVIGRRPAGQITLPFSVRLDRFVVNFYPSGEPSEYRSEVTIIEKGQEQFKEAILVNQPLSYQGITFYQSTYGRSQATGVGLKVTNNTDGRNFNLKLRPGQSQPLPDGLGTVTLLEMVDDSRKSGPAVRVLVRPDQGPAYVTWAYSPPVKEPGLGRFSFELTEYSAKYYTGLQVNRDPGVWLIWVGCALMIVGFLIAFLFAHQRLYLGLAAQGRQTSVILAGSAHRHPEAFKLKFDALADEIFHSPADGASRK